jgi:PKD repeat protein
MVEVDLENPNGKTDDRPLNNQLKERVTIVNDPLLPLSTTTLTDGCLGSRTLLTANYTGAGVVRWFDRVSDGTPLATGSTYYTGPLTKDTIFYSELLFSQKTGLDKRDAGNFVTSDSVGGLYFNCFSPFILKTVLIYPARTGILTILLRAPDGTVQQRLFNITKLGEQRVTLNFTVKLGNGYTLEMTRGRQLTITTSNLKLPYNVNGVLSIVRSTNYSPQSVYAYFYDWEIDYAYPCGRVPLFVNINKNSIAPVARFSAPKSPVPFVNGAGIANFQDSSANARSWFWDFGDGQTSLVKNPQNTYKNVGFYTVAFAASNAQGCSDVTYKTIEVKLSTAVDDITKLGQQITVFPNPATNQINVGFQLEKTANVQMQVTNVLGQTLQLYNYGDVNVATQQLDTQPLPSGSYFLVFAIDGKRIVKKIQILEK